LKKKKKSNQSFINGEQRFYFLFFIFYFFKLRLVSVNVKKFQSLLVQTVRVAVEEKSTIEQYWEGLYVL